MIQISVEHARLYNEVVTLILEAYDLADGIRVIGPGQHNRVQDIQEKLMIALERLADVAPNQLSSLRRNRIARFA